MTESINTPENIDRVAKAFLKVLTQWFTKDGMYNADRSGRVPCRKVTGRLVLDANDHFDANMAMDEAFTECGLSTFDEDLGMTDDASDLFNAAWERAAELADAARVA